MSERISFTPKTEIESDNSFKAEVLPRSFKHALAEAKMNIQLRYIRNGIKN